jgi:hypothetical protein
LSNIAAFDPGPPYGLADRAAAMATAAYAADVNDVKARGAAVSAVRTAAQAELAQLIHIADFIDLNAVVRRAIPAHAKLVENARTFALLNMAACDALVVLFTSKYKYSLWRPLQAIQYADEDGNPATIADPTWTPLGPTPSHPEYLSGHTVTATAMIGVAAAILGDDTPFTLSTSNAGAPPVTRTFKSFSEYSDAVIDARVDMGFHFRSCCELSQKVGYRIADTILATRLLPQQESDVTNLAVRGTAGRGGETLVAGFTIDAVPRQVLVRGLGPRLSDFGVTGALADPAIAVYNSAGHIVAQNDNWSGTGAVDTAILTDATARAGAFPLALNAKDAAVLTTLAPGSYTVHASGAGGASGVTMLEVYQVPQ